MAKKRSRTRRGKYPRTTNTAQAGREVRYTARLANAPTPDTGEHPGKYTRPGSMNPRKLSRG